MSPYPTGVDEMWSISLKTSAQEIGSVNLTFRAKLPKRGIIAGDRAYLSIMNYVRAERAVLVFPDGSEELLEAGESEKSAAVRNSGHRRSPGNRRSFQSFS